ncbi:enolase C-terminal domain-like protein [Sphingomonas crocodyli]|uniref:Mandelate racemase n=1 Tax=Sphingomonas crocodyli TaxID=1979270 RepID=A0A437M7C9_9SPHN|nr:enolase C-terminal domain-like protein [Sphingomonas crocodyli]RVT93513.1 mandelate racemase [Sphingomonas crocodyli]
MSDFPGTATMARIVSAEVFEIEAAFVTPYKLTHGTVATTTAVMIKLVDADGIVGWGEANAAQSFTGESSADVFRALNEILLPAVFTASAPEPGWIDRMLDGLMPKQLYGKGSVSMALLDILGKRLNVPVSTLLGGAVRDELPVLWPLSNGTAEDDYAVIDEKAAQGFTSFMLKMGTSPIADEIARVAALEARYSDRIGFIADANQGWDRTQSREFLDGVKGSRLVFVEQPVIGDDLEGLAELARSTTFPISVDESLIGLEVAGRIASLGAASIFSIKCSKNGGPLRAQRIASVAEAFGFRCYMNSMLEFGITQAASLQHAMTINNLVDFGHAYMSTLRLAEDPTDFGSFVRNGRVKAPARPGLGIEVDEDHVRRLAIKTQILQA